MANPRVGIAGCGNMGRRHARYLAEATKAVVVAVMDTDGDRVQELAREVDAQPFTDIQDLLSQTKIDALFVATPPGIRQDMIVPAAKAGVALFVEKPPAIDLVEARLWQASIARAKTLSSVGLMLRYYPLTKRAQELLAGRHITLVRTLLTWNAYQYRAGFPTYGYQKKVSSGGPLCDQALHVLDVARYIAGDVSYVFAQGGRLVHPGLLEADAEDTLALVYRFSCGAFGVHSLSAATDQAQFEIEFLGPDFRLMLDYSRYQLTGFFGKDPYREDFPAIDPHRTGIVAFIQAVSGEDNDIRSTCADAVKSVAIALADNRSLETAGWETVEVL